MADSDHWINVRVLDCGADDTLTTALSPAGPRTPCHTRNALSEVTCLYTDPADRFVVRRAL